MTDEDLLLLKAAIQAHAPWPSLMKAEREAFPYLRELLPPLIDELLELRRGAARLREYETQFGPEMRDFREKYGALLRTPVFVPSDFVLDKLRKHPLWLVWNTESRVYWAPNNCGYRASVEEAGRYTLHDALECCRARSREHGKPAPEIVVPSPELVDILSQ